MTGRRTANHHTEQPAFHRLRRVPAIRAAAGEELYGSALYRALLRGNLLQQPWMIQRETFLTLGGFAEDIRYCEDWELYQRLTRDYPVALSDAVISEHIVEGTNLHLSDKQSPYHMEVLRRRLRETPRFNWYERWLLSWKLATYHKMAADRHLPENPTGWWTENLQSFWYWPLDHVVAARALVLGPVASLPRNRRSKSKTEIRDDLALAIDTAKESLATSRRDLTVPEKGFHNDPKGL